MVKKGLISVVDFLLFSNLFIALCAVAQGLVTYQLLETEPDPYILALIFFATLAMYNFSMLMARPMHPENSPFKRVRWIFSHYRLTISMTLVAVWCLIPLGVFYLSLESQFLLAFTALTAVAYNFPFLTLNQKKIGLRNIPGIKLFLIAMVWSVSCVLLPIVELESTQTLSLSSREAVLLVAKRFLFIAAITVPFDIRDLFQDKLYELKTIPVMLGERKAYVFCQALLAGYLALLFLFDPEISARNIGLSLTIVLTGWLIFKANIKKNEYYYFGYLDGTMILQYLMLLTANLFI